MAQPEFQIEITGFAHINEIPGAWTSEHYRQILTDLDASDDSVLDEELAEFCVMHLQDREPVESTAAVLRQRLSGKLTAGQIQNLAIEFADEKHWEHYADLSLHQELFNAGSLIYRAFPDIYNEPNAVSVDLEISALNAITKDILSRPIDESFVLRALAGGLSERSILSRLFEDQLKKGPFPEAGSIIWCLLTSQATNQSTIANVISSQHWLGTIAEASKFQSFAFSDKVLATK